MAKRSTTSRAPTRVGERSKGGLPPKTKGAPSVAAPRRAAAVRASASLVEAAPRAPAPSTLAILTPVFKRGLALELTTWYHARKRDLPWRRTGDPYAIWLSEVMLQQTRVDTVIPYFERFLGTFPTVRDLADAPIDDVLSLWSGLGYYRRARMLHATAAQVRDLHGGAFPKTAPELRALHGVGPYTAGAVASIAFNQPEALVDGNVARVLSRLFAIEDDLRKPDGMAELWRVARALVPPSETGAWNQALMELGATVCVPRDPRCLVCPVRERCEGRKQGLERALPRLSPKAKPILARRLALVGRQGGHVLLAQRKVDGTFGGMWEPPSVAAPEGASAGAPAWDVLLAQLGLDASTLEGGVVESHGTVVHVLSHRRLEVQVGSATLKARRNSALPLSLPKSGEYIAFAFAPEHGMAAALGRAERRGDDVRDRGTPAPKALTTFARKVLAQALLA